MVDVSSRRRAAAPTGRIKTSRCREGRERRGDVSDAIARGGRAALTQTSTTPTVARDPRRVRVGGPPGEAGCSADRLMRVDARLVVVGGSAPSIVVTVICFAGSPSAGPMATATALHLGSPVDRQQRGSFARDDRYVHVRMDFVGRPHRVQRDRARVVRLAERRSDPERLDPIRRAPRRRTAPARAAAWNAPCVATGTERRHDLRVATAHAVVGGATGITVGWRRPGHDRPRRLRIPANVTRCAHVLRPTSPLRKPRSRVAVTSCAPRGTTTRPANTHVPGARSSHRSSVSLSPPGAVRGKSRDVPCRRHAAPTRITPGSTVATAGEPDAGDVRPDPIGSRAAARTHAAPTTQIPDEERDSPPAHTRTGNSSTVVRRPWAMLRFRGTVVRQSRTSGSRASSWRTAPSQ